MSEIAYCRVSTVEQTTTNQLHAIRQQGFEPELVFTESGVSGSVAALQRPEWARLEGQLRKGDKVIVSALDRLGRDMIDVVSTLTRLAEKSVSVFVLSLGHIDLTSPAGKLTVSVLAAVAEMERNLIVERTQAGLARAKAEGKRLGRAPLSEEKRQQIYQMTNAGCSKSQICAELNVSDGVVGKVRREMKGSLQ